VSGRKPTPKKIVIPPPAKKPRGAPTPPAKVLPNPKKEAERRRGREKVDVEKETIGRDRAAA
jgi:hypothetical protein